MVVIPGVTVVGDVSQRETSESGQINVTSNETVSVVIKGLYDDLNSMRPAKGDSWASYPDFVVDSVVLDRGVAGAGILRIALRDSQPGATSFPGEALTDRWEIDWRPVEKPLLTNPEYDGYEATYIDIDLWRNEPKAEYRKLYQYQNGEDEDGEPILVTLAGKLLDAAKLIAQGIESWIEPAPTVIRIRTYKRRSSFGSAGFRETPAVAPPGYVFLKMGDNWSQQEDRSWLRREEWQGGKHIDTTLYAEGEST